MRYIKLFPRDARSSDQKKEIIAKQGSRLKTMKSSHEFQSYGEIYWDASKEKSIGYGGYHYDGRYAETAKKFMHFYGLRRGDRIFELACGKGFFLVEFLKLGMEVSGIDISKYAIENAHPDVKQFLSCGDFIDADLPLKTFDLVIAKDCLPHMPQEKISEVLKKLIRISRRFIYCEIEVCRTPYECEMLYRWDITHLTRESPEWWHELLKEVDYHGDYHFKVLVEDSALPNVDFWKPNIVHEKN